MRRRGTNKGLKHCGVPRHGHGNLMKLVQYQNRSSRKSGRYRGPVREHKLPDGVTLHPTKGYQRSYVGHRAATAGHSNPESPRAMRKLISVLKTAKRSVKRFRAPTFADLVDKIMGS